MVVAGGKGSHLYPGLSYEHFGLKIFMFFQVVMSVGGLIYCWHSHKNVHVNY